MTQNIFKEHKISFIFIIIEILINLLYMVGSISFILINKSLLNYKIINIRVASFLTILVLLFNIIYKIKAITKYSKCQNNHTRFIFTNILPICLIINFILNYFIWPVTFISTLITAVVCSLNARFNFFVKKLK